jgi:hypothetical protein
MAREQIGEAFVTISAELDKKWNRELAALDRDVAKLERTANRSSAALRETSKDVQGIGKAADASGPGLRKIENGLTNLALSAAGLSGPLGKVVEGMLLFGAGSAAVNGIAIGVSVIGAAFRAFTADLRGSEEQLASTSEELFKLQQQIATTRNPLGEAERSLEGARVNQANAARQVQIFGSERVDQAGRPLDATRFAQAQNELAEATLRVQQAQLLYNKAQEDYNRGADTREQSYERELEALEKQAAAYAKAAQASKLAAQAALAGFTEYGADDIIASLNAQLAMWSGQLAQFPGNAKYIQPVIDRLAESRDAAQAFLEAARSLDTTLQSITVPETLLALTRNGPLRVEDFFDTSTGDPGAERRRRQEALRDTQALTQQIGLAGRGAIDLAQAFGDVSDEAATALNNMVQIGEAIPLLVAGLSGLGSGNLIAGVAGLAGGIAGLVGGGGESAEDKAQREALDKNTGAIEQLENAIGDLGASISGNALGNAFDFITQNLDRFSGDPRTADQRLARIAGRSELEQIAREIPGFGEFVPTINGLKALREALAALELNQYANTFAGALQQFQDAVALFDITDPVEQLLKAQSLLRTQQAQVGTGLFGIPVFAQSNNNALGRALAGADLSTAEGRAALEQILRDLYRQLPTLEDGQLAGFLGDLTSSEFIDALKQIEALLDVAGQGAGGQTVGFAVQRMVTEETQGRTNALLTTANYWAEATALATAATARHAAAIEANTAVMAAALGDGSYAASVDRALAARASTAARASGNLLVS